MNVKTLLQDVNQCLLNGRLDEAEAALLDIEAISLTEQRMKAHFQAILVFHRGRIPEAQSLLLRALEEFGSNVNLLRDLVVCQYHANDMVAFRSNLNRLEILLLEQESNLEPRTLLECELMLGKFLEEEARLAPALLFYDRALSRAHTLPHRYRVLIQKARWEALYEPSSALSLLYRELISVPLETLTQDLKVELQHSLMLIELRLIGADHAWQRIEELGESLSNMDRRLLVFDFVEGSLSQDLELNDSAIKAVTEFDNLDPYETYLSGVVRESFSRPQRLKELTSLASRLPWSSYLRLLCLTANLESQPSIRQELNLKIQLIIQSLDPRTQALWNQRLKQALQAPEIKMDLSLRERTVVVQNRTIDLSKKKIALQLLSGLVGKSALSVDAAIHLLWQSSFSPEHYHRLRMSTHRLNSLVHEITGLGKIIEVDSQTVRLRPQVRLKLVDPVNETKSLGL